MKSPAVLSEVVTEPKQKRGKTLRLSRIRNVCVNRVSQVLSEVVTEPKAFQNKFQNIYSRKDFKSSMGD